MRTTLVLATACAVFGGFAGAALATVYSSPQGEFRTNLGGRLEYDPSRDCEKPYRPYSTDSSSAREQYIGDAHRYLRCMQDAAQEDATYANQVIADGLKDRSHDFVEEVELGS